MAGAAEGEGTPEGTGRRSRSGPRQHVDSWGHGSSPSLQAAGLSLRGDCPSFKGAAPPPRSNTQPLHRVLASALLPHNFPSPSQDQPSLPAPRFWAQRPGPPSQSLPVTCSAGTPAGWSLCSPGTGACHLILPHNVTRDWTAGEKGRAHWCPRWHPLFLKGKPPVPSPPDPSCGACFGPPPDPLLCPYRWRCPNCFSSSRLPGTAPSPGWPAAPSGSAGTLEARASLSCPSVSSAPGADISGQVESFPHVPQKTA